MSALTAAGRPEVASLALSDAASRPFAEVFGLLASCDAGLDEADAAGRLDRFGPNLLPARSVTAFGILLGQLRNPLLILLFAAAVVSAATGGLTDAVIIAAIMLLSVGLGFVNEYRAARAVAALHGDIHYEALVWREGRQRDLDVSLLVPGDVVALRVGGVVPADLRIIEADQLECDEAVLTGESMAAAKTPEAVTGADSAVDLSSCAFMGTVVHQGAGRGVVVSTGSATAFGAIAVGLGERQAETAFQVGLRDFSGFLVRVAGALTISIFAINVILSRPLLDAFLFSLAIAIGITPQLLPAIVSVSLSTGSRALARKRVLVKRLVTIEDLGNIEVLFTDKTGTLTEGNITFHTALGPDGQPASEPLVLGLLCNEATLTADGPVGGNALDQALCRAPAAEPLLPDLTRYARLGTLPFDHERQLATVLVRTDTGMTLLVTKGAPEAVLARCVDTSRAAAAVLAGLFADGARVVAVATREGTGLDRLAVDDEHDLRFAGFLTFVDRPKADAGASIAKLNRLGIAVKVITGDNGTVAGKVCRDIGLDVHTVLTGVELEQLDDDALAAAIPSTTVFARVSPDQKSRIIKLARRGGVDVAFLGDGVNDAVALHAADVGISVESATDVAKDAADIVLLDKDLGVLAEGVTEGRRIFANTMKYVLMATSSNFGNMFSAAGASLFLSFLPMLPSQILLNNLLYDVGQLAIPTDRVDSEVLARPSAWDIAFVRRFMAVFGPVSSVFDFMTFYVMIVILNAGHREFRTGWFVESLATQTLVIFVIRTRRVPFLRSRPSRAMIALPIACATIGAILPFSPLSHLLGFASLPLEFFLILVAMIAAYLVLAELVKARFYRVQERPKSARPTYAQRHRRHVHRRAARFTRRAGATTAYPSVLPPPPPSTA
ncbi:MAG: magnesium-translocating P-type ATPase [Actinomycetota bacterium]|nr:magnesium-translocating P-type ATPase [Actinomycetota bacterium]